MLALILAMVFTVLLIARLRLDSLRLLLPCYGPPSGWWLMAAPPRHEGIPAIVGYAWTLLGALVLLLATLATRP